MGADLRKNSVGFDIDTYIGLSAKLQTDDLDFDTFREQPLDAKTLRCLRYMHDVEFHTICYLRDVLVTRAHKDPEITTFLTFWAYEEHFHGDAIARVLAVHDEANGRNRVGTIRTNLGPSDRINPLVNMVASWMIKDFVAIHMTWGAVNEWVTQGGYARVATLANHPTLTELLKRIMKQEGKHIDFYSTHAAAMLDGNKKAQRLTRAILKAKWALVGSGLMARTEVDFITAHLLNGDEGLAMAQRIDRRVDRLPGLDGLHLLMKARQSVLGPHLQSTNA